MISRMNSRYYDDLFSKSKGQYTSFLRPGSCFIGTQLSDKRTHEVQIHLKEVDFDKSKLSGFLRIQNLTVYQPELTTFFTGEIIGPKYSFYTENPEWGSSPKIDKMHWSRFQAWRNLPEIYKTNDNLGIPSIITKSIISKQYSNNKNNADRSNTNISSFKDKSNSNVNCNCCNDINLNKTPLRSLSLSNPSFKSLQHLKTNIYFDENFRKSDYIFMRWKELFIIPPNSNQGDSTNNFFNLIDINENTSYAGFYYICFNQLDGNISGFYYHQTSKSFQQLELSHVTNTNSNVGSYEFR